MSRGACELTLVLIVAVKLPVSPKLVTLARTLRREPAALGAAVLSVGPVAVAVKLPITVAAPAHVSLLVFHVAPMQALSVSTGLPSRAPPTPVTP
jgi:hypothetical protein